MFLYVLNFSIFSCWMGFKILIVLFDNDVDLRANKVFGGMCRVIGEWSKLRLWSLFVVDVYRALLDDLI